MPRRTPEVIAGFGRPYDFLSNFYAWPVRFEGLRYPTNEHAFAAAKTLDPVLRHRIQHAATPRDAKRYGRQLRLRKDWEMIKQDIMLGLLREKFSSPVMARLLEDTGDAELIEANNWGDTIWGQVDGEGLNLLGVLLMRVRQEHRLCNS